MLYCNTASSRTGLQTRRSRQLPAWNGSDQTSGLGRTSRFSRWRFSFCLRSDISTAARGRRRLCRTPGDRGFTTSLVFRPRIWTRGTGRQVPGQPVMNPPAIPPMTARSAPSWRWPTRWWTQHRLVCRRAKRWRSRMCPLRPGSLIRTPRASPFSLALRRSPDVEGRRWGFSCFVPPRHSHCPGIPQKRQLAGSMLQS